MLVTAGADKSIKDDSKRTALNYAVVYALDKNGNSVISKDKTDAMKALLRASQPSTAVRTMVGASYIIY